MGQALCAPYAACQLVSTLIIPAPRLIITMHGAQAYDEKRRAKDAEREAYEAAEEAAAAEREAARQAAQDAEASKWVGQISLDEAGDAGAEEADGPVRDYSGILSVSCATQSKACRCS